MVDTAPTRQARLGLLANCCAVFMTVMDTLIVNVALESIQRDLGAGLAKLQWVVDAYTLTFASCLLVAGVMGDRFGYRRLFGLGLWIFLLASLACGLSPDLSFLVAARAFQGLGASLLLPNALSLLNRTYEDPAAKAKAVGIWACCSSAGASAGPVLGGFLVGGLGWRSIFFINIPVGLFAFFMLRRSVAERRGEGPLQPLDALSQALAVVALACLTFLLIEGRAYGLRVMGVALGILGASGTALVIREAGSRTPMLPRKLLRIPAWLNGHGVAFLICFSYYGFIFIASLYFQTFRHFSPMITGLTFLPMTVLQPFLHPFLGRWMAKVGPRTPMAIALGLGALGFGLATAMGPDTPRIWLALAMMPIGLGSSLGISPALVSMLRATPRECSGVAAGIFNSGRQVGSLLGVAILGAFLGGEGHFLKGLHGAVALASGLMLLGLLGTLLWAQDGPGGQAQGTEPDPRGWAEA